MNVKNNVFVKLFIMILVVVVSVFFIQYLARSIFFNGAYISQAHNRNISTMLDVSDRLDEGDRLNQIIFDLNLTDVNAYLVDEDFIFLEESFRPPHDRDDASFLEDFEYRDGVYYDYITGFENERGLLIYYKELLNGDYLVFEQVLYGLSAANETQGRIDMYVVIVIGFVLLPLIYLYSKRFTDPLKKMNTQVKALSNLEFLPPLLIKGDDEFGELSRSINKVSVDLNDAISKLKDDIEFEKYKDKKRRELIASLSHELKTPITTMRAVIEGMTDNIGRYQDRDKYLKESLEYLKYMETLSKDLIDAINIESKTITFEPVSLNEMINLSNRFTKKLITEKEHDYSEEVINCNVLCNKDMIQRVFINLINNASLYSKPNSQIKVSNKIEDDVVTIYIENTNAKIDENELPKIFEAFYRIEKSRSKETGGSGLGLFIIKTILEGHESEYNIRNTDNGVLFTFTLKKT